jgi:hypothetical protein
MNMVERADDLAVRMPEAEAVALAARLAADDPDWRYVAAPAASPDGPWIVRAFDEDGAEMGGLGWGF